jgi:transcriptional regulator NrdR family protein
VRQALHHLRAHPRSRCRRWSRRTARAKSSTRQAARLDDAGAAQAPVSVEQVDAALERIQDKLLASGAREVPSTRMGELVMRELKRIDKVAYVRFASVYRSFEDVDEFPDSR